jgi:[acyl-carrier-protein] S-malonyltransferase
MIGYLFSGQGSQKANMTDSLCDYSPAANRIIEEASEYAGIDLKTLDNEKLAQTRYAQLAIVSTSLAAWKAWQEELKLVVASQDVSSPDLFGGFSLGEYSMLAAAGILDMKNLINLVSVRSELMQEAAAKNPGAMFAVLGLDADQIIEALKSPPLFEKVFAVNFNCPGQTVISGSKNEAVMAAEALKAAGAKRCLQLNVNGAFHTRFMQGAAGELEKYARGLDFKTPSGKVFSNMTSEILADDTDWPSYLASHLCSPVYWSQEVLNMKEAGAALMLEIGFGKVLTGLVKKIDPNIPVWPVESGPTLKEAIQALSDNR